MSEQSIVAASHRIDLHGPVTFDVKPYEPSVKRDIFAMNLAEGSSGTVENTPQGQLPDHLKIVGILIGHPSQLIVEDSLTNKTYFIDEGHPQAGIKITRVYKDQMIINYQGQDIAVPINRSQ